MCYSSPVVTIQIVLVNQVLYYVKSLHKKTLVFKKHSLFRSQKRLRNGTVVIISTVNGIPNIRLCLCFNLSGSLQLKSGIDIYLLLGLCACGMAILP